MYTWKHVLDNHLEAWYSTSTTTHRDTELSVAPVASLPVLRRSDHGKCILFQKLRKWESSTPFWKEITDLNWEKHITQLWASSWTGRKFSDQPCFQVVNLALEHSANTTHNHCHLTLLYPAVYWVFDIYRSVVLLFFMWPSVSAFPLKPLCSAQLLHNPRVVHIQNAGPRLFAIHIPRILIEEILTKKGQVQRLPWSISFTANSPPKRVTRKFQIQPYFMSDSIVPQWPADLGTDAWMHKLYSAFSFWRSASKTGSRLNCPGLQLKFKQRKTWWCISFLRSSWVPVRQHFL